MQTPIQRIRNGALALAMVMLLSIAGFRYIGGYGWLESLWMVVITISTVGYGEHPTGGATTQILTMMVILLGVTAGAYTFGGFVQMMLEGEIDRALGRRRMTKELKRLNDHVIICGMGHLGSDLANQLQHRDIPFVIVDFEQQKVDRATNDGLLAVQGDATSEEVLEMVHLDRARALATALPSDANNVFITLTARNLNPDIQIIARSDRESSCRKLRQAGANKVVMPHRVGAQQMERMISRPSTADLVELFAEASHLEMELDELQVSKGSQLVGQTVAESRIKNRFNLLVVGIRDDSGRFRFNPKPEETIHEHDTLLVIGEVKDINQMKASMESAG